MSYATIFLVACDIFGCIRQVVKDNFSTNGSLLFMFLDYWIALKETTVP
jgi:hypothetical protein